MTSSEIKKVRRARIRKGIRKRVHGTTERPRLSVYRSNTSIYAQIINDDEGRTLASYSSAKKELKSQKKTKTEMSLEVGKKLAELAQAKGISMVVFDRNGFRYHGRIKALADGARNGGLSF